MSVAIVVYDSDDHSLIDQSWGKVAKLYNINIYNNLANIDKVDYVLLITKNSYVNVINLLNFIVKIDKNDIVMVTSNDLTNVIITKVTIDKFNVKTINDIKSIKDIKIRPSCGSSIFSCRSVAALSAAVLLYYMTLGDNSRDDDS